MQSSPDVLLPAPQLRDVAIVDQFATVRLIDESPPAFHRHPVEHVLQSTRHGGDGDVLVLRQLLVGDIPTNFELDPVRERDIGVPAVEVRKLAHRGALKPYGKGVYVHLDVPADELTQPAVAPTHPAAAGYPDAARIELPQSQ